MKTGLHAIEAEIEGAIEVASPTPAASGCPPTVPGCPSAAAGYPSVAPNLSAAPNFDRLASIYRWVEWLSFGPFLWWCRCAFLGAMRDRQRALVIGDGDGRFTARLLAQNSTVRVDALDASPAMLRALARRAGDAAARLRTTPRLRTVFMDARDWRPQPAESYDLVVTHFFLDCLTTQEIEVLALRVRGAIEPGAVWAVSEFAVPKTWFGRWFARPVVWVLYWAFGLLTGLKLRSLPGYDAALRESGFELAQRRPRLGGLLVSELWRLP